MSDNKSNEIRFKIMLFLHSHMFGAYLETCGYGPAYVQTLKTMDHKALTRDLLKIKFLVQGPQEPQRVD